MMTYNVKQLAILKYLTKRNGEWVTTKELLDALEVSGYDLAPANLSTSSGRLASFDMIERKYKQVHRSKICLYRIKAKGRNEVNALDQIGDEEAAVKAEIESERAEAAG